MFEFLFKYPRSAYLRGQFALLGAWPKWMLVLLIVAAAAALAWLIRSRLREAAPVMRSWRAWVIWALQTLLAASSSCSSGSPPSPSPNSSRSRTSSPCWSTIRAAWPSPRDGATRQAQAVKALQNGVLDSLNRSFPNPPLSRR
jgi:hypothetical protein